MKTEIKWVVIALVFWGSGVYAQLGVDQAACKKIWGSPVGGELDKDDSGLLRYYSRATSIELEFFEGVTFRAQYRKEGMGEKDLDSLLRLNNNQVEWEVWTVPGIPLSEQKPIRWMRSDESAMAELKDEKFTVLTASPVSRQRVKRAARVSPKSVAGTSRSPAASKKSPAVAKKLPASVKFPKALPVVGDSRERVLHLLGEPSGTMMTGGKEILIYDWGNIWIAQSKVISVN